MIAQVPYRELLDTMDGEINAHGETFKSPGGFPSMTVRVFRELAPRAERASLILSDCPVKAAVVWTPCSKTLTTWSTSLESLRAIKRAVKPLKSITIRRWALRPSIHSPLAKQVW